MTGETADIKARLDALEHEINLLQQEVATMANRDVPLLKGTLRELTASDIDTIAEFPDAAEVFHQRVLEHGERLTEVEARLAELGTIGHEQTSKDEKYAAILTFAHNKQNGSAKVALTPHEIRGCVGVSRRYAYELIDTMETDIEGVSVRDPTQVRTGTGVKRKQKALLVDCEQVSVDSGGVNQFTTRRSNDGCD